MAPKFAATTATAVLAALARAARLAILTAPAKIRPPTIAVTKFAVIMVTVVPVAFVIAVLLALPAAAALSRIILPGPLSWPICNKTALLRARYGYQPINK